MKRNFLAGIVIFVMAISLVFASCGLFGDMDDLRKEAAGNKGGTGDDGNPLVTHTHTPGAAETCIAPQLCTDCGEVVGARAAHDYNVKICTVCFSIEMASIPRGTFTMGGADRLL